MSYDDFSSPVAPSAPAAAPTSKGGYDSFSSPVEKPAAPAPYDSDKGPYKDLPVWLRPDNAFMRFSRMMEHGATGGLSSEVKPLAELATKGTAEAYQKAKEQEAERVAQGRAEFGMAPELIGGFGGIRSAAEASPMTTIWGTQWPKAVPAIAPKLGERIGSAMKAGAAMGAVSGATEGSGTAGERATNALESAGMGAVAGPLLSEAVVPAAAGTIRALTPGDRVGHAVRTMVPGMKENVDRKLFYTLREQGMTPDEAWARVQEVRDAAKFGNAQLEPQYTLADTGPATQNLLYSAKSTTGPAKAYTENFLEARAKGSDKVKGYTGPDIEGQHERVTDYTQRALQVATQKNAATVEDRIKAGQKAATTPAYDAFKKFPGTIPVEDILQSHAADIASKLTTGSKLAQKMEQAYTPFMDEPHGIGLTQMPSLTEQAQYNLAVRSLNKRILKAQNAGDQGLANDLQMRLAGLTQKFNAKTQPQSLTQISYDLSPEKFDAAKKQLDGMIRAAYKDPERQYEASLLLELKHALVRRADEVTAVIDPTTGAPKVDSDGNIVSLYSQARDSFADPQDVLDAIDAGRNFKKEDIDRIRKTMREYDTQEKRGYRVGAATDIRQDLGEKPRGANVAGYFNKPNMEVRMQAMAGPKKAAQHAELMGAENEMAATLNKVNRGSRTEENKQANEDFKMWSRVGQKLLGWRPMSALTDLISTSVSHLYRYRKTDAMQIARALLETDPARQKAILDRLGDRYGPQSVTAAMNHAANLASKATATGATGPIAPAVSSAVFGNPHAQRLNEIENGPHSPQEKRDMRRKIIQDALLAPQ